MTTNRPDVYRRVHRGLRKALFDLTYAAGRTDWTSSEEVARLQTAFLDTFEFLRKHGEMEDVYQLPLLESKMPGITTHDSEEHEAIEHAIEGVEAALAAAHLAAPAERAVAGETFFHRLCLFVGMYLQHMTHEETVTMVHFHNLCTDEEIIDAGRRLITALGPQEAMRAMRYMIPALDAADRLSYLRLVTANVPPIVIPTIMSIAESTLSAGEYARLVEELDAVTA